ncbi:MAG TPA: PaaI family thioesterase [Ktedonobacterales bacterium]|nr:PaaI family thioesterase [Ktedonobacterales bacterium]
MSDENDRSASDIPTEDPSAANRLGPDQPFYEYWNERAFLRWMGARISHSADGKAICVFEPGDHHRGAGVGGRAVTGAVQAYIFDIVTGAAVASLADGRRPQVTVSLDVTFEHPAYDAPLTFEASVQGGGKQLFFVEGVCHDVNGVVTSRTRAIYRRFEKRLTVPPDAEPPPQS